MGEAIVTELTSRLDANRAIGDSFQGNVLIGLGTGDGVDAWEALDAATYAWSDIGWFLPTHSGSTNTEVLTVVDSDAITSIQYDLEDSATGDVTAMVWDATTFSYGTNSFYGDNTSSDTYTLSRDGFFNIFVKRSPTEFHILAHKGGFQRIRKVRINGIPVREVPGETHVQQAVDNKHSESAASISPPAVFSMRSEEITVANNVGNVEIFNTSHINDGFTQSGNDLKPPHAGRYQINIMASHYNIATNSSGADLKTLLYIIHNSGSTQLAEIKSQIVTPPLDVLAIHISDIVDMTSTDRFRLVSSTNRIWHRLRDFYINIKEIK